MIYILILIFKDSCQSNNVDNEEDIEYYKRKLYDAEQEIKRLKIKCEQLEKELESRPQPEKISKVHGYFYNMGVRNYKKEPKVSSKSFYLSFK